MKLQPVTLVLVLVAIALGGVVYYTEVWGNASSDPAEAVQSQKLFGFTEAQVKSFTVQTQLRTLKFERDDADQWQMLEPDQTPANDAAVAYLLNLLVTGSSDRTLTTVPDQQQDFGFDQPMATIEVKLDNQETHRLILGGYDFNRSQLYAQVDPSTDATSELKILLVNPEFDSAVNRQLNEWKQSQEPTSAPTEPAPTESATPTLPAPDASVSPGSNPDASVSPTPEPASPEPEPAPSSSPSP